MYVYSPCEISDFLDSASNPECGTGLNTASPPHGKIIDRGGLCDRLFKTQKFANHMRRQPHSSGSCQLSMRGSCVHFSKYFIILLFCPWGQGPDMFPWRRLQFFLFGRELKKLYYIAIFLLSLSIFWVGITSKNRENISEHCGMSLYLEMRSDSKEKFVDQFNLALLN